MSAASPLRQGDLCWKPSKSLSLPHKHQRGATHELTMETSEFAVLAFTHDETATPQKLTHYEKDMFLLVILHEM